MNTLAGMSVAIVGGGTMGLATAWAAARRGAKVRVFERFGHVHEHGSHGGFTRVIRHAYHEGSDYVDLVAKADAAWTSLGERVGEPLLIRSGLIEIGRDDDAEFVASLRALQTHGLPHELRAAKDARVRWPIAIPDGWRALWSPRDGYLRVGPALTALRREAEAHGTVVHEHARIREIVLGARLPAVLLEDGRVFQADRVVVCAGAWAGSLVPTLRDVANQRLTRPVRRVLAWMRSKDSTVEHALRALPVWAVFADEGFVYGFPWNDEGVAGFKVAIHTWRSAPDQDRRVNPEAVDRDLLDSDRAALESFVRRWFPDAALELAEHRVCLYTNSTNGDFIVDRHPDDPNVVVATGFSGHGFKFAPAIGELASDLLIRDENQPSAPHPRFTWRGREGFAD
jgi:monomeric sarcosine oxidase